MAADTADTEAKHRKLWIILKGDVEVEVEAEAEAEVNEKVVAFLVFNLDDAHVSAGSGMYFDREGFYDRNRIVFIQEVSPPHLP